MSPVKGNPVVIFCSLFFLVLAAIIAACGTGYIEISFHKVIQILYTALFHGNEEVNSIEHGIVVLDVRLPRILCAVLVGGSLALAGCVFQAVLLNPLADPYTLGVSSGAAFGAALGFMATIFGFSEPSPYLVPVYAFTGGIATITVVFKLGETDHHFRSDTLILSGVIVSSILSAAIGFLKYLADEQVNVIIFWLMGSLVGKSWLDIGLLGLTLCLVLPVLVYFARDMNVLSFDDATANALGVDAVKTRKILLAMATLLTAVCVSISGIIGFIGLIVPHFFRLITGPDNRILLPASLFGGALLLLAADTVTRSLLPNEIPIGILTALIGGPFFCYLFVKKKGEKK